VGVADQGDAEEAEQLIREVAVVQASTAATASPPLTFCVDTSDSAMNGGWQAASLGPDDSDTRLTCYNLATLSVTPSPRAPRELGLRECLPFG
jgi:hypothetical protein